LNGYIPETFVDVLTARVNEALSEQSAMAQAQ
jgi:hypothetical protein